MLKENFLWREISAEGQNSAVFFAYLNLYSRMILVDLIDRLIPWHTRDIFFDWFFKYALCYSKKEAELVWFIKTDLDQHIFYPWVSHFSLKVLRYRMIDFTHQIGLEKFRNCPVMRGRVVEIEFLEGKIRCCFNGQIIGVTVHRLSRQVGGRGVKEENKAYLGWTYRLPPRPPSGFYLRQMLAHGLLRR